MRKLNLDTLQVESFATTSAPLQMRGTVQAHAEAATGTIVVGPGTGVSECVVCMPWSVNVGCIHTYDLRDCGETKYMDCTYGCTHICSDRNSCGNVCWVEAGDTPRCDVG